MRSKSRSLVLAVLAALAGAQAAPAQSMRVARSALDGIDAATRGPSVEERLAIIRERVQAAATYPPLAQLRRIEGTALVAFEIDARGEAREVAVAATSGSPQLDRAAERAVRDAGRLPWVYGRLEVPVRFELIRR